MRKHPASSPRVYIAIKALSLPWSVDDMPSLVQNAAVSEGQEPRCGEGKCLIMRVGLALLTVRFSDGGMLSGHDR